MAEYRNHHATIFLPSEVAGPIEVARGEWDPDMAARIAAHVTLVYPQEAPITDLLVERVGEASNNVRPFRLRLGGVACFERPEGGVYVNVDDIEGGYSKMREEVLRILPTLPLSILRRPGAAVSSGTVAATWDGRRSSRLRKSRSRRSMAPDGLSS